MGNKTARPTAKGLPAANVSARVDRNTFQALESFANAERRTLSQLVRFALEEYVQRHIEVS